MRWRLVTVSTWAMTLVAICGVGLPGCDDEDELCAGVACSGHGTCYVREGHDQPSCRCDAGYRDFGTECLEDVVYDGGPDAGGDGGDDPCATVTTCAQNGECWVHDGEAECSCDEGWVADGLTCRYVGGWQDADTDQG